jgi:hypothetical protein
MLQIKRIGKARIRQEMISKNHFTNLKVELKRD